MTKNEELNELFKEWEKAVPEYNGKFVSDGIINENLFNDAGKKILFIAKEPNDPLAEKPWDFRDIWKEKEEFKNSFTFRIAEWALGILNEFNISYDELWTDRERIFLTLQRIAFMNIKKIGGGGVTNYSELLRHLAMNKTFLLKEIYIINPDIIVLGISFDPIIKKELFDNTKWTPSCYGIDITLWNGIKVIDFYHPSSRNAPAAVYSLLQNVVRSNQFISL